MKAQHGFGRLVSFDEKSRNFPIRALIADKAERISRLWPCDIVLDQGSEGACTGFSVSHEAAAEPVVVPNITDEIALEIYRRARQLDEWPGEDYDGSSVLGAMKAAKERGWYDEYRWAFGEEDLALALGYKGPAVLGINWYEGMSDPDRDGLITATGSVQGGHAILCNGYDAEKKLYRLHNSWGKGFGVKGECFVCVEDMVKLLKEDGEACIPVVRTGGDQEK
jgi:hypothetical protein